MKRPSIKISFTILILLFSIIFISQPVDAQGSGGDENQLNRILPNLENHGYLKTEVAYRFRENSTITKILNTFQVTSTHPVGEDGQLTIIGKLFYDPIYDISDTEVLIIPKEQLDVDLSSVAIDNWGIVLKEAYLSIYMDDYDIKLGKQIVRWGELEGFDISDILNPLDFSEFIFRDVEDRYIPLWMLKTDIYLYGTANELVWIPDLKFHEPAQRGSEFEEFRLPPGLSRPALTLRNSELAYRSKFSFIETDFTLGGIYAWDDFPSAFRSVFGFGNTLTDVNFKPRYTRLKTYFTSFNKSFGNVVFNGEAAFVSGKYFGTVVAVTNGELAGELKKDHVKYGFGINMLLWDFDFIVQFVEDYIIEYEDKILQDKQEDALSIFARRKFNFDRVTLQCLTLYLINNREFLLRPRVDYKLKDRLTVSLGVDVFDGKDGDLGIQNFQFIGFFNQHDRVYTEIKYSF